MDQLVLVDQVFLGRESGHAFRELREDVLFFDRVVECQSLTEAQTLLDEGADGHAFWSGGCAAGVVVDVPAMAEMVVLGRES